MFITTIQSGGESFKVYELCLNGLIGADKPSSSFFMEATGVLGLPAIPNKYIVVNMDEIGNIKVELKGKKILIIYDKKYW